MSEQSYKVLGNLLIINQQKEQSIYDGPQNANPVTLTIGIVSAKGDAMEDVEKLIRDANNALYKGRNCIVNAVFESPKVEVQQ